MKRLLVTLLFLALAANPVAAPAQNTDPLAIGQGKAPAALEGSYITGGEHLQFLVLGSPQGANQAHLRFFTAACNSVDNTIVRLTENDVEVIPLHNSLATAGRVGNVLVTASSEAIIGWMYYIDANRGIGRLEEMARLADGGGGGTGWSPYRPAHVLLFAPPDDGASALVTLLVRCPVGTATQAPGAAGGTVVGTLGTLGGAMLDLASQAVDGSAPGAALNPATTIADSGTLCPSCATSGIFATRLFAVVYDTDEHFLKSVDNVACRCLGVSLAGNPFVDEPRLKDIALVTAFQSTYWEIFGVGADLFTASVNLQVKSAGLNVNFFNRLHNARAGDNIE